MLAGNVVALLSPIIFIPVLTYAFGPQNYDWKSMLLIRLGDDTDIANSEHVDLELVPGRAAGLSDADIEAEQAQLKKSGRIAQTMTVVLTLALLILWPMPMYGSGYIFSKPFFTGWVVVGILWLFFSAFCVGLYPLWEGRGSMAHTFKAIFRELSGKGRAPRHATVVEGQESEGSGTPPVKGVSEKVVEKSE